MSVKAQKILLAATIPAVVLCGAASAQESDALLRAEAAMLRSTLQRRDEQIEQLEAKVAELQQRIAELQRQLELIRSGREVPTASDAEEDECDPAQADAGREDRQEASADVVSATQPAEADYYGLSRLLRAIPESRMPGSEPTEEDRKEFTRWAQQTFGGKVLYAVFQLSEAQRLDNGRWVLRGSPPKSARQGRRGFFVTVVAEVSDEQYSAHELGEGDRVKIIGIMPAETPVRPINANISDVREDMVYGRVVSRRTVEVEINGWSEDYAAVLVRLQHGRLLE
ncbi:MAG: hypothetical protein ACP5HU_01345 [Phycisphaerae bacterium]